MHSAKLRVGKKSFNAVYSQSCNQVLQALQALPALPALQALQALLHLPALSHAASPDHELLQDGVCLEGDDAVHVALVVRDDDGAVDQLRDVGAEALRSLLTQLSDRN